MGSVYIVKLSIIGINFDSDYQENMGFRVSKMFLVDAQGKSGARLGHFSTRALKQLEAREKYNYSSEASTEFIINIFLLWKGFIF